MGNTEADYAKLSQLRESAVIISGISGGLVALVYTVGLFPPTVWGGTLIYVPAFLSGFVSSLLYEGNRKTWKIGLLSGLVSVLPLFVAITELYVNVGLAPDLLSTVTLSIISAIPLGIAGSYVQSYLE